MDNEQWDYICYYADTKEIITVVYNIGENPKFIININYVGICIRHDEYEIERIGDKGYFKSLNNILYLDEYRGRYID